jgi:mono/diheme cytochrome c family protein
MSSWIALLFFQLPLQMDLPNVDRNPHTTADDLALGKKLYAGRCAGCHGPGGDGGKGANLPCRSCRALPPILPSIAWFATASETEMPATLLAPREVWQISAFVRLGRGFNE